MSVCHVYDSCDHCGASYPAEDDQCPYCPRCEVCGVTVDPDSTNGTWGICSQCYPLVLYGFGKNNRRNQ